ncbi:hypothetical protein D3C71_1740400 [compost metagenome]
MAVRLSNGQWVRDPNDPPRMRRQISVRLDGDLLEAAERYAMDLSARPPFVQVSLSDLIRQGLETVLKEQVAPAPPRLKPCLWAESEDGSQSLCVVCGLTDRLQECLKNGK